MNKRILLGVDADLSLNTQYALRTTAEFMMQIAPQVDIILVHVIATIQTASAYTAFYTEHLTSPAESPMLHKKAAEVLQKARLLLQEQGIQTERCQCIIRTGGPVEELVKIALEQQVAMIIIGSRGSSAKEQIRRFFMGSISRRVLQLAPCPVMVITPPNPSQILNLVSWYTEALTLYLRTHPQALAVFTPQQVAQQFAPMKRVTPGRKEIHAAAEALDQLAAKGFLFRHSVKGELRYVND